jgi:hypothetical protein
MNKSKIERSVGASALTRRADLRNRLRIMRIRGDMAIERREYVWVFQSSLSQHCLIGGGAKSALELRDTIDLKKRFVFSATV